MSFKEYIKLRYKKLLDEEKEWITKLEYVKKLEKELSDHKEEYKNCENELNQIINFKIECLLKENPDVYISCINEQIYYSIWRSVENAIDDLEYNIKRKLELRNYEETGKPRKLLELKENMIKENLIIENYTKDNLIKEMANYELLNDNKISDCIQLYLQQQYKRLCDDLRRLTYWEPTIEQRQLKINRYNDEYTEYTKDINDTIEVYIKLLIEENPVVYTAYVDCNNKLENPSKYDFINKQIIICRATDQNIIRLDDSYIYCDKNNINYKLPKIPCYFNTIEDLNLMREFANHDIVVL